MKKIFLLPLILLFIPLIFAISVSPNQFLTIVQAGGTQNSQIFTFTNLDNQTHTLSFTVSGSNPSLISLSTNSLTISNSSVTLTITTNVGIGVPAGTYTNFINYDGGSIPIVITVQNQQQGCVVYTSPLSYPNINVQQGTTQTKYIKLIVPTCYPNKITFTDAFLTSDTKPIKLGEYYPDVILPGNYISIPIIIDTTDVSTGQYPPETLSITYENISGFPVTLTIPIVVTVTATTSPITNSTILSQGSCSITTTSMSLNSTYNLICSNLNPNIKIQPSFDSEFFKGIYAEYSSNSFTYTFQPKKTGSTTFKAYFLYQGVPVGDAFSSDVVIQYGGLVVPGTALSLLFYPSIENFTGGNVIIQVIDNKTLSIVQGSSVYINGALINSSSYEMNPNTNYEIRAVANGYNDLIQIINVIPNFVSITLPTIYDNTQFFITTNPLNATILIDDIIIDKNYAIINSIGEHNIKAVYEGYSTYSVNVTVLESMKLVSYPYTDLFDDNANGKKELSNNKQYPITFNLNQSAQVNYIKTGENIPVKISEGIGSLTFKTQGAGTYIVVSNGKTLIEYEVTSISWGVKIVWGVMIFLIIMFAIILIRKKSAGGDLGMDA